MKYNFLVLAAILYDIRLFGGSLNYLECAWCVSCVCIVCAWCVCALCVHSVCMVHVCLECTSVCALCTHGVCAVCMVCVPLCVPSLCMVCVPCVCTLCVHGGCLYCPYIKCVNCFSSWMSPNSSPLPSIIGSIYHLQYILHDEGPPCTCTTS